MGDLGKVFPHEAVEKKWTAMWQDGGCFGRLADAAKESFCIVMPPPNVTGVLHMGHLLNQTLQDVFVRRARHRNMSATWIPGTDHAGISMQVKVEKELAKGGIDAKSLGREKFLQFAGEWRDRHGGIILSQLKSLGVSCDFEHSVHTLDADYSRGVLTAFVELHRRGYIYRGKRMINWCPATLTALSDEEVTMRPQRSKLFYVKYEIVERPGQFIEISTTRPETIMGDVAVAVNPRDERHGNLVGLHCRRPLNAAEIPIIADEAVAMDFGTGALKITPAHDGVDFDIAQRHSLPFLDILNQNGTLNSAAGPEFAAMDRFVAREKTAEKLFALGALVKVEDYENSVGYSERGNVPIEPRLSEQWFLKYPKVDEAKRAVARGFIKFYPKRWEKTYLHWLENIRDWCISRQLWWGHRIPVWYRKNCDRSDSDNWHVSVDGPDDPENWEQDDDVLDTWASSWIWPFGVFGWPDAEKMKTSSFEYFYPTDVLVTGPDIIFFWVARMIIASMELLSPPKVSLSDDEVRARIPFKNVYFTGIIRDKQGRKMSKSLGNSPEPLDLIAKYGADGLRFGILSSAPSGQDLLFCEENIALGRNFCNKLWNAFRFSRMNRTGEPLSGSTIGSLVAKITAGELDIDDAAILRNLVNFCRAVERQFENFEINGAIGLVSSFFWNDYCDWYVEVSKDRLRAGNVTVHAVHDILMRQLLLILNPFIPFISDELWNVGGDVPRSMQNVYCETANELAEAFKPLPLDDGAVQTVAKLRDFVNAIRRLLAQSHTSKNAATLRVLPKNEEARKIIGEYGGKLQRLVGVPTIEFIGEALQLQSAQTPLGLVFLESGNLDSGAERKKIEDEIAKISAMISLNEKKLSDVSFTGRAPENVVAGARKMMEENITKREDLKRTLAALAP